MSKKTSSRALLAVIIVLALIGIALSLARLKHARAIRNYPNYAEALNEALKKEPDRDITNGNVHAYLEMGNIVSISQMVEPLTLRRGRRCTSSTTYMIRPTGQLVYEDKEITCPTATNEPSSHERVFFEPEQVQFSPPDTKHRSATGGEEDAAKTKVVALIKALNRKHRFLPTSSD